MQLQLWEPMGALLEKTQASLGEWSDNTDLQNYLFLGISVTLVCFSGLMSGLTLGLMSLDLTQMEVLKRSGTDRERKYAKRIMPVIQNAHFLLVTLLLCNAVAMEALPLFLDRLANPLAAILLSVTAVLFFGEIIPQAICTRYGLAIGAYLATFVRLLMVLCSPIAWPLAQLLDRLLGVEHHELFRRTQLKAMVEIHGEETGMGGKLSKDEIKIITGALDLTHKIAYKAMTPLDSVFMLSSETLLDRTVLKSILESGHSRIPVYLNEDRSNLVGIILVKELLQYKMSSQVKVNILKLRSLPRLSASTPMYDMLKLFQTGRSHMAVLTQPPIQEGPPLERGHSMPTPSTPRLLPDEIISEGAGVLDSSGGRHLDKAKSGLGTRSKPPAAQEAAHSEIGADQFGRTTWQGSPLQVHADGGQESSTEHIVPEQMRPGEPLGIITIEDVIEELIRAEIVDETDMFVDNLRTTKVNPADMDNALPDRLKNMVQKNADLAAALKKSRQPALQGTL